MQTKVKQKLYSVFMNVFAGDIQQAFKEHLLSGAGKGGTIEKFLKHFNNIN